jgi:glutathione S-transferase
MASPQIILFAYPQSPYAAKLELCLLLKGLEYSYCTVARMPPRPALQSLGVTYRRIPVLAIGNDIIFDTALAIVALEEAFPKSQSLAGRNWALQQASSFYWLDRTVFGAVSSMLPWDVLVSWLLM